MNTRRKTIFEDWTVDDELEFMLREWDSDDRWYFDKQHGLRPSKEPRSRMRRREYAEFLRSPEWAAIRKAALARAGHACTKCHATSRLHVHHKNYHRFGGAELERDLTVLCEDCHRSEHDFRERYLKQLRGEL